jgi:hypothetical protein
MSAEDLLRSFGLVSILSTCWGSEDWCCHVAPVKDVTFLEETVSALMFWEACLQKIFFIALAWFQFSPLAGALKMGAVM